MEMGGTISHGSVVAREFSIPAVVGVAGATRELRTGQRLRVDGENGVVVPLEPGTAAPAATGTALGPPQTAGRVPNRAARR
jgi:phosphoenolpyruvate-protein kinase (PTS system EI component)